MSWSINALGKASAVAKKLATDFDRINCLEPEQTIKNQVASSVATALAAFPADFPVRVEASGSQSTYGDQSGGPATHLNQLSVKIEPLWGFLD